MIWFTRIFTFLKVCAIKNERGFIVNKLYPMSLALLISTQAYAELELEPQYVSGQLFSQPIAEQAFVVDSITRDEIAQMPVQNIADILEWGAGVDVRQRGGFYSQTDVGVRGAGYEQTLILLDGIRQNHPQTGHHTFDVPIAIEDIERIEVVRGPGAGQYGPNGNAGVINFVTRKQVDTDTGRNAKLNLSGGSYGYGRGAFALAKTEKNNSVSYSQFANGTYQRSDSYLSGAELDTEMEQANYRVVRQSDSDTTVFSANYMKKKFGAQGFYGPANTWARERAKQGLFYLTQDHKFNRNQSIDVALSYHSHHDNFWYGTPVTSPTNPSNHWVDSYQARLRFNLSQNIALGYEYNKEKIESNTVLFSDKHKRDYQSVFTYGHYDFDFIQLSGSLSYLEYKNGDSYTLPVLGLVVPFGQHHLYANAGKSVRVPTLNDLYLNQAANVGSPELKPEKTDSVELGARFNLAGVQSRFGLFKRDTENAISYTKTQQEIDEKKPNKARNIESIDTKGMDVEFDLTNLLAAQGFNKASLSYARLWQTFSKSFAYDTYSLSQLEHQAILNLSYRLPAKLSLNSQYKYEQRHGREDYFMWNMGLKQQFDHWHWGLNVENILNEKYIDSGMIQAPGTIGRFDLGWEF